MTNKETIQRNIGLTFDFVNYLIDNKDEVEILPESFELEFIQKDFSKMEFQKEVLSNVPVAIKKYVRVKNTFEVAK